MKGGKAAPKDVKSTKGTITKGKGKSTAGNHGFVFYASDSFHYSNHRLLRGLRGVIVDIEDSPVEEMLALLDRIGDNEMTNHGFDEEDEEDGECIGYKKAVLLDFMINFGEETVGLEVVTAVSTVPYYRQVEEEKKFPDKYFGMVVRYKKLVFHCYHECLREYRGLMQEGGCFLTYATVRDMVALLDAHKGDKRPAFPRKSGDWGTTVPFHDSF